MGSRDSVVVIAGASRGIGRASAERFARRGARLVLAARDADALAEVADRCRRLGAHVVAVPADLRRSDDIARIIAAATARFGRIDVWIGVSGVAAYGRVEEVPTEVFRAVLETNLVAHIDAVRHVLPVMRAQGSGRVVLVGSLYSRVTAPAMSAYVTSKFGLLGFARSLRQELRGSGIDVRLVLPATIDTPIYQRAVNFSGRTPHPLPPVAAPGRVARALVRASAGRGRREQLVGIVQSATIPLAALAPAVFDAGIGTLMNTLGLRRPATVSTSGALEAGRDSLPPTASGGWRSARARVLTASAATTIAVAVLAARRSR
jgi:short-subunit dehydrogenase